MPQSKSRGFLFKREFGAAAGLFGGVTLRVTLAQAGLAFFYAVNNQIAFALYRVADPATIFLFKSANFRRNSGSAKLWRARSRLFRNGRELSTQDI